MKSKITINFVLATFILLIGWLYELCFWIFVVFKTQNKNYDETTGNYFIGIISLIIALFYTFFYVEYVKEKIKPSQT